jgi:hypothetical protein
VASLIYQMFVMNQFNGTSFIDFDTDTLKVMLVSSGYTPDVNAHDFANDVTSEVSASGYSAGGKALTALTVVSDSANGWINIDASDVAWSIPSGSTLTARAAVLYKSLATLTLSPLIAYIDFGTDQTASNGTLTIQWSTAGYLRITRS